MKSFITIKELKKMLDKKEVTASQVVSFYQERLKKYNPAINAVIEIYEKPSLDADPHYEGKLAGIPGLIKDNICNKGHITSCGSKILRDYHAPYDATVVERIKKDSGIILGRANMDEFAMGSSGEYSSYGPTHNPWDVKYTPGGSSAGSAAAVAAGLVPWALGTETGGSVRQPASFSGLVGLYPTFGLFSRYGLVAFASSTDQPGPLTKTVYDNALVTSVIAGADHKDSTSLPEPKRDYTRKLNGNFPKGIRLGVLKESLESDGVDQEVKKAFKEAIDHLEKQGAIIHYVDLENLKHGISVYYIAVTAEAASNLSRFDGTLYGLRAKDTQNLEDMYIKTRHEGFGPEVKRRIMLGNYVLSAGHHDAFYKKAYAVRQLMRQEYLAAFKDVDLLVSPTSPSLPFTLGERVANPLEMYLADYFTVTNCIIGMPALSLPCGYSRSGLPIGFQFMGPALSEELIYQVAYAYEQSTPHHQKVPMGYE